MAHVDEHHLRTILNGFTGGELEFLCENEMVTIQANFNLNMPLLYADEPVEFRSIGQREVPLWLAIALKKQKRATIVAPDWMKIEALTAWRDEEKRNDAFTCPPAYRYIEMQRVLLHYARDDIERGLQIPSKDLEERLADIIDLRQAKIKKGLEQINTGTPYIMLNNMSSMEMNTIRTFYCTALSRFQRLHQASEGDANVVPSGAVGSQDVDGDASMPQASQRRGGINNSGPSGPSQQQIGAQTQQAQEGLEQARKLRRFG